MIRVSYIGSLTLHVTKKKISTNKNGELWFYIKNKNGGGREKRSKKSDLLIAKTIEKGLW